MFTSPDYTLGAKNRGPLKNLNPKKRLPMWDVAGFPEGTLEKIKKRGCRHPENCV